MSHDIVRSMATLCLSGELGDKLEAMARAGFDGVEIFIDDLRADGRAPRRIGERCRDLGLAVTALQPLRDAEALPASAQTRKFSEAERHFDTLAELGGDFLLVCSNTRDEARADPGAAAESLFELAERAHSRQLRIGYEALAWGRHVNDYRRAWDIVREADHPALSVVLDSYHILAKGLELETLAAIPGDRIGLVQLADAPTPGQADLQDLSRHRRAFPGEGELPIGAFLAALDRTGYRGPVSLEVFSDVLSVMPTGMSALQGMRSLEAALAYWR